MPISGRNRICGVITKIDIGDVVSQVVICYSEGEITAVITTDSVRELNLYVGAYACALVKATDVMIIR